MAGGGGTRLQPLTDSMCKPALSFGASLRVVDFVLANLRNSGVTTVDLLLQYRPEALTAHVRQRWAALRWAPNHFIVRCNTPPQRPVGRGGPAGFLGTADSVYQCLARAELRDEDLVAVFGADHVYRMDLRQMVAHHVARNADATVAVLPVPLAEARGFGIVGTDSRGRAIAFQEKPSVPMAMPGQPSHALVSTGNYVFHAGVLREALTVCCADGRFDFGHDVLPYLLPRCHIQTYDFRRNRVPGLAEGEEPCYWRDVGTLDSYFQAQMDTLGARPPLALDNPLWPLAPPLARPQPALVIRGETRYSRLGSGAVVDRALLDHAVIGPRVKVLPGTRLERCVLLEGVTVGEGTRLYNVIVCPDNVVPAGERIGLDARQDRARFPLSPDGVVVVPAGHFRADRVPSRFAGLPLETSG